MTELLMRQELKDFYQKDGNVPAVKAFAQKVFSRLDSLSTPQMSVMQQKMLQYQVITEEFSPVLFFRCPFYFETGVLVALSDGAWPAKNEDFPQANGWTFSRNQHRFKEQDLALYQRTKAQKNALLYIISGYYNDTLQHFNFHFRPILRHGLKHLYQMAKEELAFAKDEEERQYLQATCQGMLCLKAGAEKFAKKAQELLPLAPDEGAKSNLRRIAQTACRVPWEAPATFYEALCTLAFLRKMLGSLEGIGPNTFGRLDVDLLPFYEADRKANRLNEEEAYTLMKQFLLLWDCHYDHDLPMISYADHELENTYTLGGCDRDGAPVFNDITRFCLRATREEEIIFPKIKCRYGKDSPKEYLNEINRSVARSTTTVLFQNDEATIAALLHAGRSLEEARDYIISGCWDLCTQGTGKQDCGNYFNLLKAFEFAVHRTFDQMEQVGLWFECYDEAQDFEECYQITLRNFRLLMEARLEASRRGGHVWHTVDALPLYSSTVEGCIQRHKDFTLGFGKYKDDVLLCVGFPNVVDSLLAMKALVFEQKKCSLPEFLQAVRNNWEGAQLLRLEAIRCKGWGDGTEASCALAARLQQDLFSMAQDMEGTHQGKVLLGHLTYTEIRWWGEKTLASPDGRFHGDYFSQGLTPSRLKHISSPTSVIQSLKALDASTLSGNSVVNLILPSERVDEQILEGFLRGASDSALMSLQLNCVSKQQLLDAQKHPERYPHLIVRVCGFSAKFTSLSPQWQQEVLSRNFYD